MATLEVCVESVTSTVNADKGGACRLELCSSLCLGGLTPSVGLLRVVKQHTKLPVFIMIRPREGDFVYDTHEIQIMKSDIETFQQSGLADGFVFGVINNDATINVEACQALLEAAQPSPCTFHRAFDVVRNPTVSLETIIRLGFSRLLTSGQEHTAALGIPLIQTLHREYGHRITIMAGAGINESNAAAIISQTAIKEIHASASITMPSTANNISMGTLPESDKRRITCQHAVARIVQSIK